MTVDEYNRVIDRATEQITLADYAESTVKMAREKQIAYKLIADAWITSCQPLPGTIVTWNADSTGWKPKRV